MKILKTYNRLVIVSFNVMKTVVNGPSVARLCFTKKMLYGICSVSSALISTSIFFVMEAKTFTEYSETFFPWGASFTAFFGAIFQIYYSGARTFELIDRIEDLIEKRSKSSVAKSLYVETDKFVEKWSGIVYIIATKTILPCLMLPYMAVSYYLYYHSDLGRNAFFLPLAYWFPFDWKTPNGYLWAVVFISLPIFYCPIMVLCDLFLAFGVCCFLATFTDDVKAEIDLFIEQSKINDNQTAFIEMFGNIVELHSTSKQLVFDHCEAQKYTYLMYFAWCMATICDILLLAHLELHNELSTAMLHMIKPIYLFVWVVFLLFVLCETANNVTSKFLEIDIYDECDWYTFPIDMQRKIIIFTANTQRSVVIEAFGNIECIRDTFKRVVKSSFSYFTILRKFLD